MTTFYDHQKLEQKWQKKWQKEKLNLADDKSKKPKKYVLDMYPYPSGEGLHVGHVESYTATDIISRYLRMKGYNVLYPQGFDAFGLPAENYAIKTGVHPAETTRQAIKNFKCQLNSLGMSYDWSREVVTSDPNYYQWTQWLFLQLYKKGLAYKKKAPVNWCESCQTVLANEQVVNGLCERCESEVVQKDLEQWFFKVTAYAEELLNKIEEMDWPEPLKHAQKNWIGRSEGALIKFQIPNSKSQINSKFKIPTCRQARQNSKHFIEVFTTRPDTLFGATYLVAAPEHPLIEDLKLKTENWSEVKKYIQKSKTKSQLERTDLAKEKTGVELKGVKAINPANKKEIPVWIADYVMMGYGTGAIMAVPAHDERDWEFAKKYNLKIFCVIEPEISMDFDPSKITPKQFFKSIEPYQEEREKIRRGEIVFSGEGIIINSEKFNGLKSEQARDKITKFVKGQKQTQYKIRDWLISRQRYWGAPIPIIYCDKCGIVPVPEKDLPVKLPQDVDFKPTGESPLALSKTFHKVKCPKCGASARRESDTMDTFVCSSWYFLRYADPKNQKEIFSKKLIKKWLPVDLYIGGMEHAVGHLIYARFVTKVLRDLGYLDFGEPFLKIRNQGIILAEDSRKMSKRWGNVINPDDVVEEYGADALRMYEMFMGPLEDAKPWSQNGIIGIRRFLEKVYKYITRYKEQPTRFDREARRASNKQIPNPTLDLIGGQTNSKLQNSNFEVERQLHKTIKKVTKDIESLHFNTAVSAMMIFINEVTGNQKLATKEIIEKFLITLSPFAPHLSEELWSSFAKASEDKESKYHSSIFNQQWPEYDKKLVVDEEVTIAIQINGKLRETIKVARGIGEKDLKLKIENLDKIQKYIEGKEVKKFIYIKDKLVNIVV
ncbi:leucine--tRNA ligase [Patescibacteria group bacterium]|nr:leucine--tRNA ligase [Patescibacteria group bacterium]